MTTRDGGISMRTAHGRQDGTGSSGLPDTSGSTSMPTAMRLLDGSISCGRVVSRGSSLTIRTAT